MPTHHNNGLTHKKHKNASYNGQNQNGDATKSNQPGKAKIMAIA